MFDKVWEAVATALALQGREPELPQMALRVVVVYVTAIVLVRLGEKRFIGKSTPFDMLMAVIMGSLLGRAITSSTDFIPIIVAAAILVALHWLFAVASYYSDRFASLVKGSERKLVEDGKIIWDNMRKSHISRKDLESAIHRTAHLQNIEDVAIARLERNGEISVTKRSNEPKVVEVAVRNGVQRVQIELS